MTDSDLLDIVKEEIKKKLNWRDDSELTHSDFEALSDLIFEQTKMMLSVSTLKRFWGKVKYDGKLRTSARNALVVFLGYESWQSFRTHQIDVQNYPKNSSEQPTSTPASTPVSANQSKPILKFKNPISLKYFVIILSVLIIGLIGVFFLMGQQKIDFKVDVVYYQGVYPRTVLFKYDYNLVNNDTVFLEITPSNERIALKPNQNAYTHYFRRPGKFDINFVTKSEKIVATKSVLVTSGGWLKSFAANGFRAKKFFFRPAIAQPDSIGYVTYSPTEVRSIRKWDDYWTIFSNYNDFDSIDADNSIWTTRVRLNPNDGALPQYDFIFNIFGSQNNHQIQLIRPGSYKWIHFQASDVKLSGDTTDLSFFEADMSDWTTLKLKIANKKMFVYLNSHLIYKTEYKQPVGKVLGIEYSFKGSALIDYISITDTTGYPIYEKDF